MNRITFLKNEIPYGSLSEAKAALNMYAQANSLLDGEPIIGRYTDGETTGLVLGICTVTGKGESGCVTDEMLTFFLSEDTLDALKLENLTDVTITSKTIGDVLYFNGTKWVNESNAVFDADYVHTDNNYTTAEKNKLSGIAAGAEVNVQSDWTQTDTTHDTYIKNKPVLATIATSGSYNDLSNKPTIPTVNNAMLTIKRNNASVGTFTANASSNVDVNINVPTTTSELTNNSGFITNSVNDLTNYTKTTDLATVATSGEYSDLNGKPTIPVKISDLTDDTATNPIDKADTLTGLTATVAELNYTDGVTSNIQTQLDSKVDKVSGKGLSTNDYTTQEKNKLAGIQSGAEVNVNADWNATSGDAKILNKPNLASVATSGSYNDLLDKPTIPAGQIQSDWNQSEPSSVDFIKNKPTIPTKTSDLENDSTFQTQVQLNTALTTKQNTLVSGTNIKTINGTSLLGSGNMSIKTYLPFPNNQTLSGTLQEVVAQILAFPDTSQGTAYLGGISGSCTPFGYGNVECKVEFMLNGLAVLSTNSSDIKPYSWVYNTASGDYVWKKYSDVRPNPEGTASGTLTSVSIDGTKYNIQGGGGGGSYTAGDGINITNNVISNTLYPLVPAQATSSNQLADKNFVNSSIENVAAYYITKNAAGDPFATKSELNSTTTVYSGGVVRIPTRNDYCIVLHDESKTISETGEQPTTRYIYGNTESTYVVTNWNFQYIVNNSGLSATQLQAVNSGITSTLVGQITTNQNNITSLNTSKISNPANEGTNGQVLTTDGNGGRTWTTPATPIIDYTQLNNLPKINSVTLIGNKTLSDLGINIPTKTSDLTNDSGFIDNTYHDDTKVDKVSGKGLSTNDYTTVEKNKLAGIAVGAEVNVNADWNASSGDAQILNKPTIPTKTSELTNDSGFVGTEIFTAVYDVEDPTQSTPYADVMTAYNSGKWIRVKYGFKYFDFKRFEYDEFYFSGIDSENIDRSIRLVCTPYDAWVIDNQTYLTSHQSLSAYRTSAAQDAIDNTKVDKVNGKGLSENDYTTVEKNKLSGIAAGAEVNVQSDWNQTNTSSDDYIKNKPTIPTAISNLSDDTATHPIDKADTLTGLTATVAELNYTDGVTSNIQTQLDSKVDKVSGKGLSTNDYTTQEKNKLAGIQSGAEVNVNADWNATSGDAKILNKPNLASVATSGSYNDLLNKPTIPTVNDATLTIQKNGTTIDTFTANSSTNKTVNITVPTALSGLSEDTTHRVVTDTEKSTWNTKSVVSGTNDGTNWTSLTVNGTTKNIPSGGGGGGGLTNYDFTTSHAGAKSGSFTITYAANTRGYFDITASAAINITFACNNKAENYLLVNNTGASNITVTIAAVTYNGTSVTKVVVPSDGISVKAGKYTEISVLAMDSTLAIVTASASLT